MNFHFEPYSAAGNRIGVAYYPQFFDIQQFVGSSELRKELKDLALKNNCDSVMILTDTADEAAPFATIVFEPNSGDDQGAFSTMCGNGVRAVGAFIERHLNSKVWPLHLSTRSGTLQVRKLTEGKYKVLMGQVVTGRTALRAYVNSHHFPEHKDLVDTPLPAYLAAKLRSLPFGQAGSVCSIGFSTTDPEAKNADGEPHLVIELDPQVVRSMYQLRGIAASYGPVISLDRKLFPLGMNVNFIVPKTDTLDEFLICTFERNLGADPNKAITQACGTGSTFSGSEWMRRAGSSKAIANCQGGQLAIENDNGLMYLSGDAIPVSAS